MHTFFILSHGTGLLLSALSAVIVLIILVARYKTNPFIALMIVSIALGIVTGMPLQTIVHSFEKGVGGILGHIAIVIGLGTILGKMMAESGGTDRIAHTLISVFGEKRVPWAMVVIGFLVGLPVFFEVGFVLLIPIAFTLAKRTRTSMVLVGLPMVAGLSVVHGLVPPHPAALLAVITYNADVGKTIFYAFLVGIPTAIVAGPLYAKIIAPHISINPENPIAEQFVERDPKTKLPSFSLTVAIVLLPLVLMMLGSWTDTFFRPNTTANHVMRLLGNADIALLVAVLASFLTLGKLRGFSRETILKFSNECLAPTAIITLLIGAGGGFGSILQDSGVAQALVDVALHAHIPLLLLAWLVAALVRVATGSATVAMTTAAGIMAPLALHVPGARPELLAIATGAGSLTLSHVNDGAFWLVKEYFNMTMAQTFKTWTVCETLISIIALLLTLTLSVVV
ncbi:MAG: gluconate:H+ symporter [Bryocella sp.]